jgi:methionine synthase I (cobalamin-dependent)
MVELSDDYKYENDQQKSARRRFFYEGKSRILGGLLGHHPHHLKALV